VKTPITVQKSQEKVVLSSKPPEKPENSTIQVKFLKTVPKFVGYDEKIYNEHKVGETDIFPEKIAQTLIRHNLAEASP